ncbi:VIT1/CCC1 transporter family protein [Candidatus Microgenomates bacterium]|nr:VIT1/CCC1 transporter family protein [Candidatus Microgenomates bacterium]
MRYNQNMRHPRVDSDYLRSVLFGIEDGLVSTTGVVVGMTAGVRDPKIIVLAGLVTIAVEALSMGAGEFLSEQAVHELEASKHRDSLVVGALLMFVSYFAAGMIPVIPFLLFNLATAIAVAVAAAFVSLFGLGYIKGKVTGVRALRSGLEIFAIGGAAALIGVVVGLLLKV